MLKNINPQELNNRSANSENIEDSQSIDENDIEPLCSFDISLNNGKKATLIINEGDNYEQKVNNFCQTYKISPQDAQVLLQKVKEEIELYSNIDNNNNNHKNNNNINNNNIIKDNNNINYDYKMNNIPQNNNNQKYENLSLGNKVYMPNESKKLDRILNESESYSLSESVNQSQNNINNVKKEYNNNIINNNINPIPNNNLNKTTINNNITMNNNINKNPYVAQNSAFTKVPNTLINFSSNAPNPSTQKFYRVNDNKNKIQKKQTFTRPLENKINPIIYNSNNIKVQNLNNKFPINNVLISHSPNNNYKNNFTNCSFNPNKTNITFRNSLVGQKIEFIDNNNLLNNKNNNIKVITPETTYKYNNVIYPPNNSAPVNQKAKETLIYGYPITTDFNLEQNPVTNKNETLVYNYENPNIINNNDISNNYPVVNNINQPKTAKLIESYRILDSNYNNQNSMTDPKSININYENLDGNTLETIINPPIEYNDYGKNNINNITSPNYNTTNFETTTNNPNIEYTNDYNSINYSPIIQKDKYDTTSNQIVEYHYDTQALENANTNTNNNQNLYNTQNEFPIYENIQITKLEPENNNTNNLIIVKNINNQNNDYNNQKEEIYEYMPTNNINNINNEINNNYNNIKETNNINENLLTNLDGNEQEKKRNTVFISNVKKIVAEEPAQYQINNENNNIELYSNVNQANEEQKNEENIFNQDNENQNNPILNNNIRNSITKENDINIASTTKTKSNPNSNLSIVQTQNIDIKVPEKNAIKNNENINNNVNIPSNEQSENKSNDIYIKKNIDLFNDNKARFNSPNNKMVNNNDTNIKQNYIKKPVISNKIKEINIVKSPEKIDINQNIRNEKNSKIRKINEIEPIINTNKDKNSNYSINSPPLNKNPINKINNNIINNNIIDENNLSEKKKSLVKLEVSSNQENINDNSSESKIIIDEENMEKEPQDNPKRKSSKIGLPKDTDDSNYKESQIQYDNLSFDSKNNNNNKSEKKPLRKSDLSNSNNDNISEQNNVIKEEEINNSLNNGSINYQNKNIKKEVNNYSNNINNKSNNVRTESNLNNTSDKINVSSIKNDKFINYIDKDLGINKPKYKKNINKVKMGSFASPSQRNTKKKKKLNLNNNIYQKKEINNNKKIIPKQKPIMKVLTIRNNNLNNSNNNSNNNSLYDKRSKSSEAKTNRNNVGNRYNSNNKIKYPGERLYDNYMKRLPKKIEKNQKLLKERLAEEDKELLLKPQIDKNSRRIIERLRSNEDERDKVEERLINYGNNKKQKHLIEYANKDLQNQVVNPFRPTINKTSRELAEKNKQNRINETKSILQGKKRKYNLKKIDLEKEFGKRNRSIGNEHKNANSFINFDEPKSNNKTKNTIKKHSNINSESNYSNNLNSYRNSRPDNNTTTEGNNQNLSPFNKTLELNNAYKELYNSIDEKIDSDLTKYFGTNGDLNLNTTENNSNITKSKKNSNIKKIKTKNLFPERSIAPTPYIKNYQNYNAFDYLYYESENIGKKNKEKQELNFKRSHPFKPSISPLAQKMKNKKESTNEFFDRISKNLEEIKIVNSKPKLNKKTNKEKNDNKNNYNFRPKITRGPKNISQREVTVNLEGFYDKRITKEKKDLLNSKKEEENEKKNLYNQKSKDIIIKMKYKKYKELFALLDSDQDGLISYNKIQLTKVDENVLKNISPILEELNQTKNEMNFKEFCLKLDKLMTEEKENNQENNK